MAPRTQRKRPSGVRAVAAGAGLALDSALTAAAGWIASSTLAVDHDLPLLPAIEAVRRAFLSQSSGEMSYYAGGSAGDRPLVLLHSINAGGSAYEMRPLFERFAASRSVYAPDLPGFGFSARANRLYTPGLYAAAIVDFLDHVAGQGGGAADVVALSLTAEFAARAALARPDLVRSLTFISPTGFSAAGTAGESRAGRGRALYNVLACPVWAQPLFDLLATRPSIHYFLARSFHGPVDRGLERYAYATTHQPGARYAPLHFVGGLLFTPNVRERLYARLAQPALVLYDEDGFVGFDALPAFLRGHPGCQATTIAPTRGLPQFDQPARTASALEAFWRDQEPVRVGTNGHVASGALRQA